MATLKLALRLPCAVHADCDETGCRLYHTDKKYAQLTEAERHNAGHQFCEGQLPKIRAAIKATGSWTCPDCGVTHTAPNGILTPNLIVLY